MDEGGQAKCTTRTADVSRSARLRRSRVAIALAFMGLLAAVARLPLIRNPVDVSPDGCEYLGIARHLASEHQWISSLKWNFFTDAPVVHAALADRPPLFPLWAAGWVALAADPQTQIWFVRLTNLLLAAVVPAVTFWALEPAVSVAAAALAAFIFMLYPGFLRNSAQPLTEPLFLLLLFSSLGRFLRATSPLDWSISGILAGLAVLTRPTGILLPLLYSIALPMNKEWPGATAAGSIGHPPRPRLPHRRWQAICLVLLGFLLPLVPYWIAVGVQTGSPFTSILRYNYSIRHIKEGTFYGFERSFEPPVAFVWRHTREIAPLVARQWVTMGSALARSLEYLLPLGLFWRRGWRWKPGVLLGFALLNFTLHALSWTVWGAARYLFPTYVIGIALLLDAPLRWETGRQRDGRAVEVNDTRTSGGDFSQSPRLPVCWSPRLAVALSLVVAGVTLTLVSCLQQDARLYREKAGPYAGVHLGWAYAAAGARLARTPPGSLSASNQPWIVNLLAGRPAVMAPRFRDAAQVRRYLAQFQPVTLTLFVTEREPEDVAVARRLVENLWTHPAVRPELVDALNLEKAELHTVRAPRQAVLMFRVRPIGGPYGR